MRVAVLVILVVVVLVALFGVFKKIKRVVTVAVSETAGEVLVALNASSKLLNATELAKITGRKGGIVVATLILLHRRELVSSTHLMNPKEASKLVARYAISSEGRRALREGDKGN